MQEDRPLAPEWLEDDGKQMMDKGMSPEEYAARRAHTIACSSFSQYTYRDPAVQTWLYRFESILLEHDLLEEYRRKYLSPSELEAVRQSLASDEF